MMNRQEIGSRLKQLRENLNLSRSDVAAAVNIGTTTLQQWETGSREASIETIALLARLYKVHPSTILFGEDNSSTQVITEVTAENEDSIHIDFYDVEASAGHGTFTDGVEPCGFFPVSKEWIRSRGLHAKDLAVINTKGDSMQPLIPEGTSIIVDTSRNTAYDGKIYVIRIEDRIYVKRTQWIPAGGLRLISDNKQYDSFDIPKQDLNSDHFQVCGQVVRVCYDLPD